MDDIEHVVVLMLENRSFDSLLGWLYERDEPRVHIPPLRPGEPSFHGLAGLDLSAFVNHADDGLSSPPVRGAGGFAVPSSAPGEEIEHVDMQFFGTRTPPPGAAPRMTGVLQDFVDVLRGRGLGERGIRAQAPSILHTYTPTQLPVLSQLARHYAVSDDWFASVPSQTNPNRAFLLTGTSHGLVDNGQLEADPRARRLDEVLGVGIGDDRFPEETIFHAVADAGRDWAVFWQTGYLPDKIFTLLRDASGLIDRLGPLGRLLDRLLRALRPSVDYVQELASGQLSSDYTWRLFPAIHALPDARAHFKGLAEFHRLARAGRLPAFSYLEPRWTIARSSADAGLTNLFTQLGDDYHPPANLIVGESFVRDVYASLIAHRSAWERTLLVITFDEFVGSFDHVPPPPAVPPWGTGTTPAFPTHGFAFDRYGARVPTILVSPRIPRGTVFRSPSDVPYDHTSVIATTLRWLGRDTSAGFGERAARAPTFDGVVTLAEPRTDADRIGFLDVARADGDPVRFGDPIRLRNGDGRYLTAAIPAMKRGSERLSADTMGFAVDVGLAAHFATLGRGDPAELTLRTTLPDAPEAVADGATLLLVTLEPAVGASDVLGAWRDAHDCYYADGGASDVRVRDESWIVRQSAARQGRPLEYGDGVRLESVRFPRRCLAGDPHPSRAGRVTVTADGDVWTVEPAVARVAPS